MAEPVKMPLEGSRTSGRRDTILLCTAIRRAGSSVEVNLEESTWQRHLLFITIVSEI